MLQKYFHLQRARSLARFFRPRPIMSCGRPPSPLVRRASPPLISPIPSCAYKIRKCRQFSWNNWISYAWKTLENQFLIPLERSYIKSDTPFRLCNLCSVWMCECVCMWGVFDFSPLTSGPPCTTSSGSSLDPDWRNGAVRAEGKRNPQCKGELANWLCYFAIYGILNISSMVNMANASNKKYCFSLASGRRRCSLLFLSSYNISWFLLLLLSVCFHSVHLSWPKMFAFYF